MCYCAQPEQTPTAKISHQPTGLQDPSASSSRKHRPGHLCALTARTGKERPFEVGARWLRCLGLVNTRGRPALHAGAACVVVLLPRACHPPQGPRVQCERAGDSCLLERPPDEVGAQGRGREGPPGVLVMLASLCPASVRKTNNRPPGVTRAQPRSPNGAFALNLTEVGGGVSWAAVVRSSA